MKTKLLFLLALIFAAAIGLSAQDTIRSLVITEWRGEWSHNSYIELTNMGDTEIDLSEFTLGLFVGGNSYADQAANRQRRLEGMLPAGESYVISGIAEGSETWIYPPGYPKIHPRIQAVTDLGVYIREDENRLELAGLTLEDDSISLGFEEMMNVNRGERAHFLFHHTAPDDSVVVDGVGLVFDTDGALDFVNYKDVAGVTNATETHILVRKFNVTEGNPDWKSTRGATPEESQWMAIPFVQGWWQQFSGEFTTAGNHNVYSINDASVKPAEGVAIDVDFDNNVVTIPWGTYRDTLGRSPWRLLDLGDGLAWAYTQSAVRDDSLFSTCQSGDILTLYAVGNELQKIDFSLNVTNPTDDNNLVFPNRTKNADGWYNTGQYYIVTQNDPDIDSILDVQFATRVDTLLIRLEKASNADWEIDWVDGQVRTDLKNGDKLVVTAENGSEKEYFIKVEEYEPNNNALLNAITWPEIPEYLRDGAGWTGDTIPNFLPSGQTYEITVPFGVKTIPALIAHKANTNSSIVIDRATTLRGSLDDRTTIFTVTAEDGVTVKEYKVIFKKEILSDWVQPFHADPFMSQVARHVAFTNFWTEFYNPGNQELDMSNYLLTFGRNGATPSEAIAYVPDYANRYYKYIPGYKYSDDETVYTNDPSLIKDFSVNPIVPPKETWLFGQYAEITKAARQMPSIYAITDFHLTPTQENVWGITYAGEAQVSKHTWRKWPMYLFKILNPEVKDGTKPPTDPADFELIDVWGEYPNADETVYNPAGIVVPNNFQGLSATRKDSIWKGNPASGAAFGTTPENSEWTDIREAGLWDSEQTTLSKWYWCAEGLGIHNTVPITVYMSTVSSLAYLVSDGYAGDQSVDGIESGTTVDQLIANLILPDPDQKLKVAANLDGSILAGDGVLSMNDTLIVTSADSSNVTRYVLDVGDPLDNNAELTSATYTVSTSAPTGTITGMDYGVSISEVLENVEYPSTAVLNVVNGKDETVPLITLRADTTYAETQVTDDIYFEVVAQNGTDKILYQLSPSSSSSDAFVLSDVYSIDQDLAFIDFINDNTTVAAFIGNIKPVQGASVAILDKLGFARTLGFMAYDDVLVVTSEDGSVSKTYYLGFKAEQETGNTDAYVASTVYTVDQNTLIISEVPAGETVEDFIDNISPAIGATFIVTDESGIEVTSGTMMDDYQVVVTSESGNTMLTYTVDVLVGLDQLETRSYSVYPNPVGNRLHIDGLSAGDQVSLLNILGVSMRQISYEEYHGEISLEDVKPGIYFIQIRSEMELSTFKIYKR